MFRDDGLFFFFFQAEDGIRDRSPSRGLGDVYKRQRFITGVPRVIVGYLASFGLYAAK